MPSVLKNRSFLFLAASRFLSAAAILMQSVAIGWQIYAMTGKAAYLGYVGLAQFLPFVALIPISGQAADRFHRRNILLGCNLAYLAGSLVLLFATLHGARSVVPIFAVLVLLGAARAFAMPASQAMLRNVVDDDQFARALPLFTGTFHVAVVAGPVLGGFLYLLGPAVVHAVVGAGMLGAILLLSQVRVRRRAEPPSPLGWASALVGLRFVGSRKVLLGAMSLDLFAVLFGGCTALLPAIAKDVLRADPSLLGFLRASPAVGAAAMSAWLARFPLRRRVGAWMFAGVGLFGIASIVFGLATRAWLSMAALATLGAGDMLSVYVRQYLIQSGTPDALRGRVAAVSAVCIGASNELGEFESGITAGWFGVQPAVVLGGLATLAVTAIWMKAFPMLRAMDRFPPPATAEG
jgi:MFS family permease